jgi:CheY-like chemotaxis protein
MSAKRILVADDDELVRELMRSLLARPGYSIEEAADGAEAVRKCQSEAFDLVLMDYNMPNMAGHDACAEIQRQTPTTKLLLLSGRVDEPETGGIRFIAKPFDNRELISVVGEMLR